MLSLPCSPGADDSLVMLLSAVGGRWPELEFLQDQLDSVAQEFGHGVEFIRRVGELTEVKVLVSGRKLCVRSKAF